LIFNSVEYQHVCISATSHDVTPLTIHYDIPVHTSFPDQWEQTHTPNTIKTIEVSISGEK